MKIRKRIESQESIRILPSGMKTTLADEKIKDKFSEEDTETLQWLIIIWNG